MKKSDLIRKHKELYKDLLKEVPETTVVKRLGSKDLYDVEITKDTRESFIEKFSKLIPETAVEVWLESSSGEYSGDVVQLCWIREDEERLSKKQREEMAYDRLTSLLEEQKQKKKLEKQEYEQYLLLKKKFEGTEFVYE